MFMGKLGVWLFTGMKVWDNARGSLSLGCIEFPHPLIPMNV